MPFSLNQAEREVLAAHGIAIFEDRAILDAQPPIDDDSTAAIETRIGGPIPAGLKALWAISFGGVLDYRLTIDADGRAYPIAVRELFFPHSGAYRDLFGWIDFEIAAQDAAAGDRVPQARLDYLPFAGSEHLDRIYVKLRGDDAGAVFAWKEDGLPESLPLRLREEPIARVADDVAAFFRSLVYERDPFRNADSFEPGLDLVFALGDVAASGTVGASAAEKLLGSIGRQTLDWRPSLEDGSIAGSPHLRDLALEAAALADDVATLARLESLGGCNFEAEIADGSTPLELALGAGAWQAVRFLLDRNVDPSSALPAAAASAPPELIAELLVRGAEPSLEASLDAAAAGRDASAVLIARAHLARRRGALDDLVHLATAWADGAQQNAERLATAHGARDAAAYRTRALHLRRLAALAPTLLLSGGRP